MLRVKTVIGLCLLLLGLSEVYAAKDKAVRFGSVAEDTPAVMHQRLTPLTNYLEKAIGRKVVLVLSPDMPSAIRSVSNGEVELAYLTPVAYLNAHKAGGVKLLGKAVTNNQSFFRLEIVVREDSPIKTVKDLVGKSFAFGDPAALLQRAVVVQSGVSLDQLGKRAFLGHYDNIARGILNKDYDAGIVTDTKARKWSKNGLRVVYRSENLPPYNIAAAGNIDEELFNKLKEALLKLDRHKPGHGPALDALGKDYDGFAPTSDAEYDVIRKLVKPFQHK